MQMAAETQATPAPAPEALAETSEDVTMQADDESKKRKTEEAISSDRSKKARTGQRSIHCYFQVDDFVLADLKPPPPLKRLAFVLWVSPRIIDDSVPGIAKIRWFWSQTWRAP